MVFSIPGRYLINYSAIISGQVPFFQVATYYATLPEFFNVGMLTFYKLIQPGSSGNYAVHISLQYRLGSAGFACL